MARFLKSLHELTLNDIPRAGGKACRLGVLLGAGLPVPRGVVVLTDAYEAFLDTNGFGALSAAVPERPDPAWLAEVREELAGAPFPDGLATEVAAALERCGLPPGTPLAVRSSSPGEDGAYRSRAGVYESMLNVTGPEGVLTAIRSCWVSLWTERALAYTGGDGTRPSMAVLIQELVPCEVAGILFTLNPLTADENEMLVEATWGLAAELASGEVTPDRFVIDFWDGSLRRAETGRKPEALTAAPGGGLERRPLEREKSEAACLDPGRLAELAALGRRVQEVFGHPQDVEFGFAAGETRGTKGSHGETRTAAGTARVFVLQARPITAYSFPPGAGQWTTANFREVMPGFASILGQSQSFHHDFAQAQEELFRRVGLWRPEDEGTVWARTFFGHGYWNVGATKRVAARIPGYSERSFDRTVGIDPTYSGDGQVTPWNLKTIAGAIPVLFALGREYRRIPKEAEAFIRWFDREEPGWDEIRPADLDDDALAARVRWGLDLHWQTNRWALLTSLLSTQAQEDFHRTLAGLEKKAAARAVRAAIDLPNEARLMTGLTGMATARPLHDLWKLADSFRRYPRALRTLRETPPAELAGRLAELAADGADAGAWLEVCEWIERYRYMSNIDEDLSVPRWSEDPSVPLSILRGYVAGHGAGAGGSDGDGTRVQGTAAGPCAGDPAEQVQRQRRVREEEEAKARAVGRNWLGLGLDPFWHRRFAKQYELVKSLCWWREETRVYLSRARYHCRRFLVEQARRWAASARLEEPEDIFWLTRDEVLALVARQADLPATRSGPPAAGPRPSPVDFATARETARRRRSVARLYRNFAVPPDIFPGSFGPDGRPRGQATATAGCVGKAPAGAGPDLSADPAAGSRPGSTNGGPILRGVGCSAGRATGPCRVAHSIEEAADLQAGEILVAPHANPAWVPLFHLAAGLVLEEGGLLSHSAVVAREYGVPAVLQVKGATRLLRTGDVLTIDGAGGTVSVERNPVPATGGLSS